MTQPAKILLIGDAERAFQAPPQSLDMVVCESVLGGIERTRREQFDIILIVLSNIQGRIRQALDTLRKWNPRARLILLVGMLEEPLAIELLRETGSGRPLADDYLICPIRPEDLLIPKSDRATGETILGQKQPDYQRRIRELEILATQDDLTGLKNRRYLNHFLIQILSLARQYQFRVTLLMFDIDNFKHYNDQFGHGIGDNVLQQAGTMIRQCCRAHDVVARIGGDEFAVVFWDLPKKQALPRKHHKTDERRKAEGKHPRQPAFMAERFRRQISTARLPFLGPRGQGKLTISGGLATFPEDGKTAEELMARADEALLEAKQKGKNKIVIVGEKNNHSEPSETRTSSEDSPSAETRENVS